MTWQDAALALAGVIGSGVAVVHGYLMQRSMVGPIVELVADRRMSAAIKRLVPGLLHFTTVSWFFGGLALIAAAIGFGHDARLATGLFAGGAYLYGAVVNLWGTRRLHPGWILYAVAFVLIVYAVGGAGS